MPDVQRDLTRNILAIFSILGLIGLSLWVLRPFLAAGVWAAMMVVATWPLLRRLEVRLGGRRGPAIAIMLLSMLVFFLLPLVMSVSVLFDHADTLMAGVMQLAEGGLPGPPAWLSELPIVGNRLHDWWLAQAAGGSQSLLAKLAPNAPAAGKWLLAQLGSLGGVLLEFSMVLLLAGLLYAGGEHVARLVLRFGRRLAGVRGEDSILLAASAIRAVAMGVGVTALVQSLLGGLGLLLAGVPFASLLSALMFLLCIAQVGPLPILLLATAWMYWQGETGWAVFLLVWGVIIATLDNFIRPALIKRGADLPLVLIFAGVIGGMLGLGLIGIFVGPVVLAVTYTLLLAWLDEKPRHHPSRPAL